MINRYPSKPNAVLLPLVALFATLLLVLVFATLRSERATMSVRIIEQGAQLDELANQIEQRITDTLENALKRTRAEAQSHFRNAPSKLTCAGAFGCAGFSGRFVEAASAYDAKGQQLSAERSYRPNFDSALLPMNQHKANIRKTLSLLDAQTRASWSEQPRGQNSRAYCWRAEPNQNFCVLIRMTSLVNSVLKPSVASHQSLGKTKFIVVNVAKLEQMRRDTPSSPPVASIEKRLSSPFEGFTLIGSRIFDPYHGASSVTVLLLATFLAALAAGSAAAVYLLHRRSLNSVEARLLSVANVSHSLRTPLTNLKLYAELIGRQAESPKTVQEYASVVEHEATRLATVVSNVLEIGRSDEDYAPIRHVAIADELVKSTVTNSSVEAPLNIDTCDLRADKKLLMDVDGFQQILTNIFDNARKYAPMTTLDIATRCDGSKLVLVVRDYGPGIDADAVSDALRAYRRGKCGTPGGFGLGLAATNQIAMRNGGELRLEAADPGLRVTVILTVESAED